MRTALRRILWVLALISVLLIFGTLSFHEIEGWSLFDGFYMTLMTLTTVFPAVCDLIVGSSRAR